MNTRLLLTLLLAAAGPGAARAHEGHDHAAEEAKVAAPAEVTGEVVDVACYIAEGKDATGAKHQACATACVKSGLPVGLLTDDGTLVLAVTKDHQPAKDLLLPLIARRVTASGKLSAQGPYKLLAIASVAPAGAPGKAAAAPKPRKEAWECPMKCVKSDKPGRCPVCGMDMAKVAP